MSLDPVALIHTRAITHNLQRAAVLAGSPLMAVIKADGYGHGMVRVARALEEANALAVARVSEAVELRQQGITKPLVVLEGFLDSDELLAASEYNLVLTIHNNNQIALLRLARLPTPIRLWVKVDTGMNRLGFDPLLVEQAMQTLEGLDSVAGKPGLMTHFACADDATSPVTENQLAQFLPLAKMLSCKTSIANSAGIIGWPDSVSDWARPGVMLYGVNPYEASAVDVDLQPAMTFVAKLIAIKNLQAGDTIGYGASWRCPDSMMIGVVGAGYGDGYPREIQPGTPVLINGIAVPIIGRVSMDMLTVDLHQIPAAQIGDKVILWGKGLPITDIATAANTIPYTLMCGIAPRVARIEANA